MKDLPYQTSIYITKESRIEEDGQRMQIGNLRKRETHLAEEACGEVSDSSERNSKRIENSVSLDTQWDVATEKLARLHGSVETGSLRASGTSTVGGTHTAKQFGHSQSRKCVGVFVSQQCRSRPRSSCRSIRECV